MFFDAGGGHRAAATALKSVIEEQGRPWEVRLTNLQELLDPLDVFRKVTNLRLQDIYNKMLAKGWTLGAAQGLRFMHAVIRVYHRPVVRLLQEHWMQTRPDMAVSLVPNFNRALHQSLGTALPNVPFVTILTDFADYPPHFWIERASPHGARQRQVLVCGTEKAAQQALELGHTPENIFRTSGMILRPEFYQRITLERTAEQRRLGLDPDRRTGLVLFGGQGSRVMLDIARKLSGTQLILICGRNKKLAEELGALLSTAPHFVEGFTREIPYYMYLSDFFIGKPGPGSISEAVAMKLPVIVERNAWTLPQERYNTEWIRERQVGMVLGSFREIASAAERVIKNLASFRAGVEKIQNRAVFEIPEILEHVLNQTAPGAA